jgi:hypothetical protein
MNEMHVWVATKKNTSTAKTVILGVWDDLRKAQVCYSPLSKWEKLNPLTWKLRLHDRAEVIFLTKFGIEGNNSVKKLSLREKHKASLYLAEFAQISEAIKGLTRDLNRLKKTLS